MPGNVQEIFEGAIDLQGSAREEYLGRACGEDSALRAEVVALLRIHEHAPTFLASPTADSGAAPSISAAAREQPGQVIDRYRLLELIGEGGFGTVWAAEQRVPVKRRVALKIIKLGMDTRQVIARFEAERQALAMMDHPNIAKVLDAGSTETGRPFFVMEYIKGVPILEYCDTEKLDTEARLVLFTQVCNAIQHAHQKGIIHRDIKPSNVLVTLHDSAPVPKVIDFGIAKATNQELTEKTLYTQHRQMIGTPAYMSPEQAEMSGLDIDTRSDIYSLGVLLYELLTGTTPFSDQELRSAGFAEMMRIIREVEPHKPSTRLSTLGATATRTAQRCHADVGRLSSMLRGDLDWIVMKCLEKDRTRRYETANGLAADIQRHLGDEPVTAGPPSAGYRLGKFVKRNRGKVVVACVLLVAVLGGAVGASWGLIEAGRLRSIGLQNQLEREQQAAADSARLARNAEAVSSLLGQCEEALHAGDAARAAITLEAARRRSVDGGTAEDAQQLASLSANLDLLNELDAFDNLRWSWTDNGFDAGREAAANMLPGALKTFGIDPENVSVEKDAAAANGSAVRERIVAALDRLLRRDHSEGVRALLRRLDSDPYRNDIRDAVLTDDVAKMKKLVGRPAALEQPPEFAAFLGESGAIDVARRVELLQAAVLRRPASMPLMMTLGYCYPDHVPAGVSERMRWYQAALAVDPGNSAAYNNLGVALIERHEEDQALACFQRAIALDPTFSYAELNLAGALDILKRPAEAEAHARKAIELDPKNFLALVRLSSVLDNLGRKDEAVATATRATQLAPDSATGYSQLGIALYKSGEVEKAIVSFRRALEIDPKHLEALLNLGSALDDTGHADEAIVCYRKAIEIDPKIADAYYNLAVTLRGKGQSKEAFDMSMKALELNPHNPLGQIDLGYALSDQGRPDEAMACFRKALEIDPRNAVAYYNAGIALFRVGLVDEAVVQYRKAIDLNPDYAEAHGNLGQALLDQGNYDEALSEYKRGHELGIGRPNWGYDSGQWIRDVEAKIARADKLPALLKGEFRPGDNAERLEFANICVEKSLNYAALGLYTAALTADATVGESYESCVRCNAAAAAALSATGKGQDAAGLGDDERTRLRKQALDWLRADLNDATRKFESGNVGVVPLAMSGWLRRPEFASIRDPAGLAKLPAEERAAFKKLWDDVAALLKRAQPPIPKAYWAGAPSATKEGN
jgi:tetratricopeptide (TPR) repeat protein/tRNA A-37 threonylcarbamoyl transferase component Bud32